MFAQTSARRPTARSSRRAPLTAFRCAIARRLAAAVSNPEPGAGALRILVADTDPQLRDFLRTTLGACGHTVVPAANAAEAHLLLKGGRFDCAILELFTPMRTGLRLLKSIRRSRRHRTMPVGLLVEHEGLAQRLLAERRLPVDVLLVKPFGTREVLEAVRLMQAGGQVPLVLGRAHGATGRGARQTA